MPFSTQTYLFNKNIFSSLKHDDDPPIAENVLNSISHGVFSVNKSQRISSFNRAAEKLTGWQQHEVLGKTCQEIFRCHDCKKCILLESIKRGVPLVNHSITLIDKHYKQIHVKISTTPLLYPDGKIAGGVQVFHNTDGDHLTPVVSICVLGDLELMINGHQVYDKLWKGRQSQKLLKAIIALGGTRVSLEKIAFLLWPDSDGDHALNSLKTALYRLRKVGGTECSAPSNWLAVKHKRVSLVRSVCWVDALEFARSMERVNNSDNGKALLQPLKQYTNDFLPDDNSPWVSSFRNHLRQLYFEGLVHLASQRNTGADNLVAILEQVNQPARLREESYACLMEYFINAGFPAKALTLFNHASQNISSHTGRHSSAALQSLAARARKVQPHR